MSYFYHEIQINVSFHNEIYIQICSFQIIFLLLVTIFFRGLLRGMLILAVIIKLSNVATKDLLVFC